jgi:ABC-type uncharacterized transport system YnjBCD ATPase subunit
MSDEVTVAVPLKAVPEAAPIEGAAARPLLRLSGISKTFANGTTALADVDLDIRPGEFVSLLGPSGCGKSTLLKLIAGLAAPSSGTIDWPQSTYDANGTPEQSLGFVFQEPTLLPWRTLAGNVHLPLMLAGMSKREARGRVEDALAQVGLAAFADVHPHQLSGGMKMRVSIARAGDQAKDPADGRALCRTRRNHAHEAEQRSARTVCAPGLDRHLRHAQCLRVGLSVQPDRGDELAAGTGDGRNLDRGELSACRGIPHVAVLQRAVPAGIGCAAPRDV